MFETLPKSSDEVMEWTWEQFAPYVDDLQARELTDETVHAWLADWTRLSDLIQERYARLSIEVSLHTEDEAVEQRYNTFLETIYPQARSIDQRLGLHLLRSGLEPAGFEVPLRNVLARVDLFREENLPLKIEERKLASEYDRIMGAQTIEWEGEELTMPRLTRVSQNPDRAARERAWRMASDRVLADREAINAIWRQLMDLRDQMAVNAEIDDYRELAWLEHLRFDYTPADAEQFHAAIEEVVVPAAERVYRRRAAQLGLDVLRPWDVNVNVMRTTELAVEPPDREPLHPFADEEELAATAAVMFDCVDPQFGIYFAALREEGLLDLTNYKGKAAGGYCMTLPARKRPFIFMNSIGVHDNVQTLLHEAGHAFHAFEELKLPYHLQREAPMEFSEVASMAMELLAAPYLTVDQGGFYEPADAARARAEHLESLLVFWPYMAVVDAFQHWAYTHHDVAGDPAACDAKWLELWGRFIKGVDWSGLEQEAMTGWHRKLHIFRYPFYYVEYGLAQLGAVQIWRNALAGQQAAVAAYRRALALGGTVTLPELFRAAGARFAFDSAALDEAVTLIESTLADLGAA